MRIQKKSMLNSLNSTKKAIVATNSEKPNVSAPVTARQAVRVIANARGRIIANCAARPR